MTSRNNPGSAYKGTKQTTDVVDPFAADNRISMPENSKDDLGGRTTGEITTALGDDLPAGIESKRLGGSAGGKKKAGAAYNKGPDPHTKKGDVAAEYGRRVDDEHEDPGGAQFEERQSRKGNQEGVYR